MQPTSMKPSGFLGLRDNTQPTGRVLFSGKFFKLSSNYKIWRLREFFVMKNQVLRYFNPETRKETGSIMVRNIVVRQGKASNLNVEQMPFGKIAIDIVSCGGCTL
jgi:hypothetical protein